MSLALQYILVKDFFEAIFFCFAFTYQLITFPQTSNVLSASLSQSYFSAIALTCRVFSSALGGFAAYSLILALRPRCGYAYRLTAPGQTLRITQSFSRPLE